MIGIWPKYWVSRFPYALWVLWCLLAFTAGCRQKMAMQPNIHRPLKPSAFFDDGRSERPLLPDTVARGHLHDDPHFDTGRVNNEYVKTFPFPVSEEVLLRGRQRFDIYCVVCHDPAGTGNGKIVQRGFTHPPNFHTDLSRGFRLQGESIPLRDVPVGYIFDVITHGFGAMPDYREQIPARDRWAIVAHVRVLQLSQNFRLDALRKEEREQYFSTGDSR
jgi:hypothetical protein